MKVVSVARLDHGYVRVTFERAGDQQTKHVRLSLAGLQKAAVEANRDMIVREVGIDKCRLHPDWLKRDLLSSDDIANLI